MNNLVARPGKVANVKRARRVRDTHAAETLDVAEQVASTAKCQATMEYRHGPVLMLFLFETIRCFNKSELGRT